MLTAKENMREVVRGGNPDRLVNQYEALSLLIYLQTGRVVRLPTVVPTQPTLPSMDTQPTQAPVVLPVFSQQDLLSVIMRYGCESRPDLAPLLTSPLTWNLRDGQPAVLIIHTLCHGKLHAAARGGLHRVKRLPDAGRRLQHGLHRGSSGRAFGRRRHPGDPRPAASRLPLL